MESYAYLFLFVLQLVFTVVVLLALLHEKQLQKQLEKKNKQLLTELLNLRGEIQAMRSTLLDVYQEDSTHIRIDPDSLRKN
ncbi:hypothetical protein NXW13_00795 [Bacteroides thetaiotaomicron]|nr:hypothetical protein [Bacteroides thetaiotaomicron]